MTSDVPTVRSLADRLQRLAESRNLSQLHVVFVLRSVPPYRLPFLAALARASSAVRISVITADALNEKGKQRTIRALGGIRMLKVRGVQIEVWKYTLIWMQGCRKLLDDLDCDVAVLEGSFGILSHLPLALSVKRRGKAVVFWTSGWHICVAQYGWEITSSATQRPLQGGSAALAYRLLASRWDRTRLM